MRFAAISKSPERATLNFSDPGFSGSGGQNVGAAGSMATLANTFASYRSKAPKYGDIGQTSIAAENAKWRAAEDAKTSILGTGVLNAGRVKAAEIEADAFKKAAEKRKSGAMLGAAIGAVASVGSALIGNAGGIAGLLNLGGKNDFDNAFKKVGVGGSLGNMLGGRVGGSFGSNAG